MNFTVVEILPIDPNGSEVTIVPLYEQVIEKIQLADFATAPCTLAQALWMYAGKQEDRLLSILEGDESACKFVMKFKESWFVRAEVGCEQVRETRDAVEMARTIHLARVARQALDECNSK